VLRWCRVVNPSRNISVDVLSFVGAEGCLSLNLPAPVHATHESSSRQRRGAGMSFTVVSHPSVHASRVR